MALREISQKAFHSYWNDADEDTTDPSSPLSPVGPWPTDDSSSRHAAPSIKSSKSSKSIKAGLKRFIGHRKGRSSGGWSFKSSSSVPEPEYHAPQTIHLSPAPPEVPTELRSAISSLQHLTFGIAFVTFCVWLLVAFHHSFAHFVFFSLVCGGLGFVATDLSWSAARDLERQAVEIRWHQHRERGRKHSPPFPESVEWLNSFIEGFWGQINPEIFNQIVDTVEDIMQASLPQFIDAVKISDVGQGKHPVRIVSIRPLSDREKGGQTKSKREDRISQALNPDGRYWKATENRYINLEVAFAYRASKGGEKSSRESNIHLLMEFFVGVGGWAQIPLPVWVQIEEIVGTVRVRLQLIPNYPFVSDTTISFMGVPAVSVSAIPLARALPNVLNLPFISSFVRNAIAAGTAVFTAPKSLTLNVEDIMANAAIGDTRAAGVFIITVEHAEGLSAQDKNGQSDPYIVFSYSRFGRSEYSTRTILRDLNPCFHETFPLLLTSEQIKEEESLLLMLWDHDKLTKDDLIGRVKIPVLDLVQEPGKTIRRADAVKGFEKGGVSQGTLHWSYAYYPKLPLNVNLQKPPSAKEISRTAGLAEREMRPGDLAPNPAAKDTPPPPASPLRTPPDPRWTSGILSVVVHELTEVEKAHLEGSGGREGEAGQDTDDPADLDPPSPYAELLYNDQMLYRTRCKPYARDCIMEAGTEKFVRNYHTAVVKVVIRNKTLREKDPILGIVHLPLEDVLKEACEVTRIYPIERGVGFGLARITILFRAVELDLPTATQGWETGVLGLDGPIVVKMGPDYQHLLKDLRKITLDTADGSHVLRSKEAAHNQEGEIRWDADQIRLPVYFRQQAALVFEFEGLHLHRSNVNAIATLWLYTLTDHEELEITLPIYRSKDLEQLKQNYINDFTKRTHEYKQVGTLTAKVVFRSGLGPSHYSSPANGPSGSKGRRHALEAWDVYHGQAILAQRKAEAEADGSTDHQLRKDLKRATSRQKQYHQTGKYEVGAVRTFLWAAQGVRERVTPHRTTNKRRPIVLSERDLV